MTVSLADLIAQKATLERQIHDAQAAAKAEALARVRQLMAEHGLTAADIVATRSPKSGPSGVKKVAAKYRDPASGSTWSGRGLKPKWLAASLESGKTLADFAI
jgi:DNA-binding protein H-NS